jgi:3D (Asp-Asp-Asp) domain-containing protein
MKSLAILMLLLSLGNDWWQKPENQEYLKKEVQIAIHEGRIKRVRRPAYMAVKPQIFVATAYEGSAVSCGYWARFHKTFTGIRPKRGVIAVDPRVVPLHSKLYIEHYGYAQAEDTGGAIKGKRVDLFMNTISECRKWGRRKVKVYILPKQQKKEIDKA